MKVNHAQDNVKGSSGLGSQQKFAIANNSHAFRMLSSGLYSDKITAVLREIGCNAFDAHVAAGIASTPIEVKLPNRVDHQFYIKDFGPGLTHDEVMNLYTTYFASTKQQSNDFTGAFGLGSKSPFSYVDSFTVTSVTNGKKRTYSAHIANDGAPTIALLTTEDADVSWKSGLMIGFSVKPGDYVHFQEKAREVFRWFRTPPRIEGAQAIPPVEVTYDGPEFMRVKGVGHLVVMGNVSYPLAAGQLEGLTDKARAFFMLDGLVLKVGIGDVRVTMSREALEYDKEGMKFLINRCEKVAAGIGAEILATVQKFHNASWKDKCATTALASRWTDGYFQWNTFFQRIGEARGKDVADVILARRIEMPTHVGKDTLARRMWLDQYGKVRQEVFAEGYLTKKNKYDDQDRAYIELQEHTEIYYGKAAYGLARARNRLQNLAAKQVVFITVRKKADDPKECETQGKKLSSALGGIPAAHIDSVPVPPGFAAKGSGKARAKRAANSHQQPLPKADVGFFRVGTNRPVDVDVTQLGPDDYHYMCRAPHWEHSDRGIRLYEKTVEEDKVFAASTWSDYWLNFSRLQKDINMPRTSGMVFVDAATIRRLELPKRGWRSTFHIIGEWLASKGVRDAVADKAAKWRPTAVLPGHLHWQYMDWATAFTMLREDKATHARLAPVLGQAGIESVVADIYDASKKAGSNAGKDEPTSVTLYKKLQAPFGAPPIVSVGKRTFLSPEDYNIQLVAKFPMLKKFATEDLMSLKDSPAKQVDFLKFLLS